MDPTACLRAILEACEDWNLATRTGNHDTAEDIREEVLEHLDSLKAWTCKKGVLPNVRRIEGRYSLEK